MVQNVPLVYPHTQMPWRQWNDSPLSWLCYDLWWVWDYVPGWCCTERKSNWAYGEGMCLTLWLESVALWWSASSPSITGSITVQKRWSHCNNQRSPKTQLLHWSTDCWAAFWVLPSSIQAGNFGEQATLHQWRRHATSRSQRAASLSVNVPCSATLTKRPSFWNWGENSKHNGMKTPSMPIQKPSRSGRKARGKSKRCAQLMCKSK